MCMCACLQMPCEPVCVAVFLYFCIPSGMLLNSKDFHLAYVFTYVTASVCVFLFLSTILLMFSNGISDI